MYQSLGMADKVPVIVLTSDGTEHSRYPTIKECAKQMNIAANKISECAQRKGMTQGYIIIPLESYDPANPPTRDKLLARKRLKTRIFKSR